MRQWLRSMLLLPPLFLGSGCVTHALWTNAELDNWNEPAPQSNLRVYAAGPSQDYLVVYDELSGRHDTTRTRAYFLYQNQDRMARQHTPHFANTNLICGLEPVPVFRSWSLLGTNLPPTPFVMSCSNAPAFTFYYGPKDFELYTLPVYDDGTGKLKRVALTPLAVTADAVIVASVAGLLYVYIIAGATIPN